jgi:hypothetical protein
MPHDIPFTQDELSQEVWKPIPNYPGYEASNIGRIRSWRNCANGRRETPIVLKQAILFDKRLRITPVVNGKTSTLLIHRAVLMAFRGECPVGLHACHNDDNCWNNRLDNLRWDTPQSNYLDQRLNGKVLKGEASGCAKLTEEKIIDIRLRYAEGELSTNLCREYGVVRTHITDITAGRAWQHTGGPITKNRNKGSILWPN